MKSMSKLGLTTLAIEDTDRTCQVHFFIEYSFLHHPKIAETDTDTAANTVR